MSKPKIRAGKVGQEGIPEFRSCTCHIDCNGPVGCMIHDNTASDFLDYDEEEDFAGAGLAYDYEESLSQPDEVEPDVYPVDPHDEIARLRDILKKVRTLASDDGMLDNMNQSYTCSEIEDLINREL